MTIIILIMYAAFFAEAIRVVKKLRPTAFRGGSPVKFAIDVVLIVVGAFFVAPALFIFEALGMMCGLALGGGRRRRK